MRSGIRLAAWHDHAADAEGQPIVHDCVLTWNDGSDLAPGEERLATLVPFPTGLWPEMPIGTRFDFWEGTVSGSWAQVLGVSPESR